MSEVESDGGGGYLAHLQRKGGTQECGETEAFPCLIWNVKRGEKKELDGGIICIPGPIFYKCITVNGVEIL